MVVVSWVALGSTAVAALALVLTICNTVVSRRQRRREEAIAVATELYPALRSFRDAAFSYSKPLNGEQPAVLIALRNATDDLAELEPAISDRELRGMVQNLLQQPATLIAKRIDPERFKGTSMTGEMLAEFRACADVAHAAVKRCQSLRRGVTETVSNQTSNQASGQGPRLGTCPSRDTWRMAQRRARSVRMGVAGRNPGARRALVICSNAYA